MIKKRRVLVVDGLPETREVLQTVLEPRGLSVERADRIVPSRPDPKGSRPDVIVIDVDLFDADSSLSRRPNPQSWNDVPHVVIGSAQIPCQDRETANNGSCYLRKPFQYSELIRAVEQILASHPEPTNFPQ